MRKNKNKLRSSKMFRCDFCEQYRDKSECRENPLDPYFGNICEECFEEYGEAHDVDVLECNFFEVMKKDFG